MQRKSNASLTTNNYFETNLL